MTITETLQNSTFNVDETLQQAVTCHKSGNLEKAELLYRAILNVVPQNPDANHNLGVLAVQLQQPLVALPHFSVALENNPNQQQYWLSYIDALIQTNQPELARQLLLQGHERGLSGEAVEALVMRLDSMASESINPTTEETEYLVNLIHQRRYLETEIFAREITERFPLHGLGWKALGVLFKLQGRTEESLEPMQKALALLPGDAEAHCNLGVTLNDLGRLEEAEESYHRALEIKPDYAEASSNLGNTLYNLGRLEEAEAGCRRALEIKPDYAEAHSNLGVTLRELGRLEEAEASCRHALEIKPDYAEAHNNLAITLQEMGRLEEAEDSCRRALEIKPDYAEAHSNLGNTLRELGRLVEAEAGYRRALEVNYNLAEAHNNLGVTLKGLGCLDEAVASYRHALEIKPDYAGAYSNLGVTLIDLGRLEEAEACCRRALEIKPNYAEAHSNLLFILNYSACSYFPDHFEEACSWEARSLSEATRAAARERQFSRSPLTGRRLRVGYVSSDFRKHAVSYFVEQLFAHHDAARVEVFAYSNNNKRDVVTERIKSLVEHWVPVAGLSDQKLLARIEADQIDLLIDLSGHTANNRLGLFALRAAPVQAHWLGYFASTGLTEMDYWIGDATLTPTETDHHFKETVWRLPRIWVSYEGKAEAPDSHWQPAQDGTVCLGSFNNLGKLTPATLALWTQLLHNLPKAKLLLKTQELAEERNRQRILDAFTSYGIGHERIELQDRSITADWSAHMAYYDRLDIALDPVGAVGGGTTTCDALWMGVPVVSLVGDRMASRMTASMLDALGRSEWLATSEDEYVAKVMALAHDIEGRKAMRANQRARMASSPLCDAKGLAQTLEDAFEKMFERWWVQTKKMN